jgi:MFS family permease
MLPSAALAGIFVVVMAATTVSTPLYPLYETRFGLTPLEITIVFAAYGLGVMGGLAVTGRLSDHIGRKPPLAAGLVIGIVAMALFIAANGLGPLLVGRLLIGVTAGLFTGTATAWLVDLDDDRQRATRSPWARTWEGSLSGPRSAARSRSSLPIRCGRPTGSS